MARRRPDAPARRATAASRVSDVLRDRRVPPSDKARQLVPSCAGGEIVWLVGHRLRAAAAARPGAPAVRLVWTPVPDAPRP